MLLNMETHKELNMSQQERLARAIAILAHAGQFRRDGVTPYVTHPAAVAEMVSPEARAVAFLHDGLEDQPLLTIEMLNDFGVSNENINSIILLTKRAGEDYFVYINRLAADPIAREVKIADIKHNLSQNPKAAAIPKYKEALKILESYK